MIITRRNINDFLVLSKCHRDHHWCREKFYIYFTSIEIYNKLNVTHITIDLKYSGRKPEDKYPDLCTKIDVYPQKRKYDKMFHAERRVIEEYINNAKKILPEFIYRADEHFYDHDMTVDMFYYNIKTKESYLPNEIKFNI